MAKNISRKKFIKNISFSGVILFGGSTLLSACRGKDNSQPGQSTNKANSPCSDTSGLTDAELATRTSNEYMLASPYNDKMCGTCNLFIMPKEGKPCGSCQVVKGPISPQGYCRLWIKKVNMQS
jgi:hypothetical protein